MCTYITSLPPSDPTPPGHHRTLSWASRAIGQLPTSYLFYTWSCIYVNSALPIHLTLPSPHCVHTSIFYICISFKVTCTYPAFLVMECAGNWGTFDWHGGEMGLPVNRTTKHVTNIEARAWERSNLDNRVDGVECVLVGIHDFLFPPIKRKRKILSRFQPSAQCSCSVHGWGHSVLRPFCCYMGVEFGGVPTCFDSFGFKDKNGFLFKINFFLKTFGCFQSPLLREISLVLVGWSLAVTSHFGGFSRCRAQALGHVCFSSCSM